MSVLPIKSKWFRSYSKWTKQRYQQWHCLTTTDKGNLRRGSILLQCPNSGTMPCSRKGCFLYFSIFGFPVIIVGDVVFWKMYSEWVLLPRVGSLAWVLFVLFCVTRSCWGGLETGRKKIVFGELYPLQFYSQVKKVTTDNLSRMKWSFFEVCWTLESQS